MLRRTQEPKGSSALCWVTLTEDPASPQTSTQLRNLMIQEWTIHFKPIKAGSTEGKEFQVSNDLKESSCSGQYTH